MFLFRVIIQRETTERLFSFLIVNDDSTKQVQAEGIQTGVFIGGYEHRAAGTSVESWRWTDQSAFDESFVNSLANACTLPFHHRFRNALLNMHD